MSYLIFVKTKDMKQFRPLGTSASGEFGPVINRIFANHWETKEEAEKACDSLKNLNPEITFKVRSK